MQPSVLAALITGGVAIIAPIITFVVTKSYENRFFQTISPDRCRALCGVWKGIGHQAYGPTGPFDAQASLTFKIIGKRVTGEGRFATRFGTEDVDWSFKSTGGFLHDRFLRLDYNTAESSVIQFGSIVLELAADGKRLNGLYQGYGVRTEKLIHGILELNKVA